MDEDKESCWVIVVKIRPNQEKMLDEQLQNRLRQLSINPERNQKKIEFLNEARRLFAQP